MYKENDRVLGKVVGEKIAHLVIAFESTQILGKGSCE
jgi:hypothetical protein